MIEALTISHLYLSYNGIEDIGRIGIIHIRF
jgi:hypothetical protein